MKKKFVLFSVLSMFLMDSAFAQNNWGIAYVQYPPGQVYADPNIEFEFRITNHGPNSYPAGTVINTASRIVGTVFSLDLLGPGPTPITLAQDLNVGESFSYDPGYLDGAQTLAFFAVDTGEFCLIVYGTSADPVNLAFPNDPNPSNNIVCLTWTNGQVFTGTEDHQPAEGFSLFPNPSSGSLNLDLPSGFKGEILLYSMQGRLELRQQLNSTAALLELDGLPAGQYLYRILDARQRLVGQGPLIYTP